MDAEVSDIVVFFGRFHPLVLHLPIGFLSIAFLLEILCRVNKTTQYTAAVALTLWMGSVFAVITAVFGYMLGLEGGFDEHLLSLHKWTGIGVAVLSVITLVLYTQVRTRKHLALDRAYLSAFTLLVIVMLFAGHYGGSLTHGSDYLTQHMPPFLRKLAGLPSEEQKEIKKITNLPEAIVFDDIIHPILDQGCVSCHNASKSKGDLMMHTPEALLKGGESGPAFVPGSVEKSDMMKRIYLPESHDDHMPPKGKRQLTNDQITLLAWWIREGSPFDKKVSELKPNEEVQAVLNTLVDPDANKSEVEKLLARNVNPADVQVLDQLHEKGLLISPLKSEVHWLKATIPPQLSADSLMDDLTKVSGQLTWLDLGETGTTDKALTAFGTFKNLTRLHLENTSITDAGLKYLRDLSYLEYLNLYGTKVSDQGIQQLASLKNLKKLYVWQTQVTPEGAAKLQQAVPGLEVNLGTGLMSNK